MAHPAAELVRRDARGEHEARVRVAEVVPAHLRRQANARQQRPHVVLQDRAAVDVAGEVEPSRAVAASRPEQRVGVS